VWRAGFNPIAGLLILAGSKKWLASAAQKAREKIRDLYCVEIEDQKILQQIVDIAKQTYAGNLDMAIRTQQVRDLIQLYAMSAGKTVKGMPPTPHPLDLVEAGGALHQSPGYSNGAPLPGLGGLPVFDAIGAGTPSGGGLGTTVVNLQIDSTTVGSVVLQNGRVVAQGVTSAMKANVGRRTMASPQLSPGLVMQ
jgi:hypothetical protein